MRRRTVIAISAALISVSAGLAILVPRDVERQLALSRDAMVLLDDDASAAQDPGNSEALGLWGGDSVLSWSTRLGPKRQWPYAGIRLVLGDSTGFGCQDWAGYDTLHLSLSSTLANGLTLGADTHIPPDQIRNPEEKTRRLQLDIPSSRDIRTYAIALRDFQVPHWWKESYKLNLLDNRGFLESVCAVNLTNNSVFQPVDGIDTTSIYQARLTGRTAANPLGGLFVVLGVLALLLPIWRPQQFGLVPPSSPAKVALQNHERELARRIADWYDRNYMKSELSMEGVAREIGLHPKKLQTVLRETFHTTHKAHLSKLRLDEAARLLRETGNPVGEIALSVGFNAPSHFNRVFKERFGVAPQAYRSQSGAETAAEEAEKGPEGPN